MNASIWARIRPLRILGTLFGLLALLGCNQPVLQEVTGSLSDAELTDIQSHLMSSFNATTSTAESSAGRATITLGSNRTGGTVATAPFPNGVQWSQVSGVTTTLPKYPDASLTSALTAVPMTSRSDIYDVTVLTSFDATDARKTYTERYAVQDITYGGTSYSSGVWGQTPDGWWTFDDPIVAEVAGVWTQNQMARTAMTLTFRNNDNRAEVVYDNVARYAMTNASSDSLQVKGGSVPALDTSGTVGYSSVVGYVTKTTSLNSAALWPSGTNPPNIMGLRYYSEANGAWSCVSFEIIVTDNVNLSTWTYTDMYKAVFQTGQGIGQNTPVTRWGTSCVRENSAGVKTMATNLFSNLKNQTYSLTLDATGKVVLVKTTTGTLIQTGL